MSSATILVRTDTEGDFTITRTLFGLIRGIAVDVGTLETPDILLEDGVSGATLLDLTGQAASAYYTLGVPLADEEGVEIVGAYGSPVCFGSLVVTVTGGGNTKTGRIRLLLET